MTLQLPPMPSVLSIESGFADGIVTTRFRGTADVEAHADLQQFLKALHTEIQRVKASNVVIDFRELEFMNSSSFKLFVGWLGKVRELPSNEQYNFRFLSNPNMLWQRRGLAALSCFAVKLVSIET
jgi:hypothetical protein